MSEPLPPAPPSLAPISAAILTSLRTGTGKPFGDLGAPPSPGPVYGFLSRVGLRWEGTYGQAQDDMAFVTYQVQCVALDSAGVEALEHRVQQLLVQPPDVPGWHFVDWEPLGSPGGIRLDRDTDPERAFSTPQWRAIAQKETT